MEFVLWPSKPISNNLFFYLAGYGPGSFQPLLVVQLNLRFKGQTS